MNGPWFDGTGSRRDAARRVVGMGLGVVAFLRVPGMELQVEATRMVALTVEQLTSAADWVVDATVEALEVARDAERRVFTRTTFRTNASWKGAHGDPVFEVVGGGGVLGDVSLVAGDQEPFELHERALLFLVRNPNKEWVSVGAGQGRFKVTTDAATGVVHASNRFWGRPSGARPSGLPGMDRVLELAELRRRVTEANP